MQLPEPEINCSICDKPVALETAKTDEVGQAVHEECYLLKVGSMPDPDSVHRSKQIQCVHHSPDDPKATPPVMKGFL
jgi:hypothetical protein